MDTIEALDIGDCLAIVNAARLAFGKEQIYELPNATTGDPAACLFYRALADCGATGVDGASVSFASPRQAALVGSIWGVRPSGANVPAPSMMRRTISNFDSDRFPHYNVRQDQ